VAGQAPTFSLSPAGKPAEKTKKVFREEALGTNWLPRLGIVLVVVGVAYWIASQWGHIPAWGRVAMLYPAALGVLAGGVLLERKRDQESLGRALIGGGWAITFLITYAISHVDAVRIIHSPTAGLFFLVAVAVFMIWHTLRYNSQAVTGIAFLMGFVAVAINSDPPYDLIAGGMLVAGLTVLVIRRGWFELEVFGILAAFLNHFRWIYESKLTLQRVPDPNLSVALIAGYWAIFRISYLVRKVSGKHQESVSTVAALLNTILMLAVMKYQSLHPQWAFWALLTLGAIEFTLGQLPAAKRRITPFMVLSSLGAVLMAAAIPIRFAGTHSLELIWLAGAEAFLLAGIFTKEKLFCSFGTILSFLVAFYLYATQVAVLEEVLLDGTVRHDQALSLIFAVIAVVFYANAHVLTRLSKWMDLFSPVKRAIDQQSLVVLSYMASLFTVCAVYLFVPESAVAAVLALLVVVLAWFGRRFSIADLVYQSHWIALAAVADVAIRGFSLGEGANWHGVPLRVLTFGTVAAALYLGSWLVETGVSLHRALCAGVYRWLATGLLVLMIGLQTRNHDWWTAVLWIALALALAATAQILQRTEFKWQAFALTALTFAWTLLLDFSNDTPTFHHLSYRLIAVTLVAGSTYLLARWSPHPLLVPVYPWAGTILLGILVFEETWTARPWTGVLWIGLAAVLGLAARYWKDRALLWQTHLLSFLAAASMLYVNLQPVYRQSALQLETVLITAVLLYTLTRITRIAEGIGNARVSQLYSWAGSMLLTWLAWYQLQPINVSLAWAAFGLVLFEIGYARASAYMRAQGYVAFLCSFAHIFYANLNTLSASYRLEKLVDPPVLTALLLVPIYFWVYARLHAKEIDPNRLSLRRFVEYGLTIVGTATLAALVRFEMPPEMVAVGYSVIILALLVVAWRTRIEVFSYQALIMLAVVAFRLVMHNFYNLKDSFSGSTPNSIVAIALLTIGIPIAFRLRSMVSANAATTDQAAWWQRLLQRPEQPMFFVPVILTAMFLAIREPGLVTLAWGGEGLVIFVLALFAKQRSYRLTGLGLLMICVAKIVVWDVWRFEDVSARVLTLIGVGGILLVVRYLYGRNREALSDYL